MIVVYDIMIDEKYILQDLKCFFNVREMNADFIKENNFIFICYFEMCKMLFLFITKKYGDLIFFL